MVQIPDYRPRQGLRTGGSVKLPAPPDAIAGRATEAIGSAVQAAGADLVALQQTQRDTADDAWFSNARAQTAVEWQKRETELRLAATGPATGFADNAAKAFGEYRTTVVKGAPSARARERYDQWATLYGAEAQQRAYEFEQGALIGERASNLDKAFGAHVQAVFADPDQYDTVLARAYDDLEGAKAWLTPEQELKARTGIEEQLQLARAQKLAKYSPLKFQEEVGLGAGPINVTVGKIINTESGGNPDAKNPNSSAAGLGQFTEDTWIELLDRSYPEFKDKLSRAKKLEYRFNETVARDLTQKYAEENAKTLMGAGLPVNEATLYLAHFAGPAGAIKLLTASPDAKVDDILGAAVVKANPFLAGKSVAWLAGWAADKMGGTVPKLGSYLDNPRYSRLSPEQIAGLARDADSAVLAQHNAAVAEQKAVYATRFNSLMTGILDGRAGQSDIDKARKEGWLADYDDINKARTAITTRDKEQIATAQAVARFSDPGAEFNFAVKDDRDALDLAYKAMGGSAGLAAGDAKSALLLRAFVERGNTVPESAVAAIRGGMWGRDPVVMGRSFQIMDGLYRENPGAVTRSFSEADVKRLQDYQALAPMLSPEELRERLDPFADPKSVAQDKELRAQAQVLSAKINTAEILNAFDASGDPFVSDPAEPIDPRAAIELRSDFETLFAERYAVSRNFETAKAQAFERLHQKWGASEIGSGNYLMPYPPERVLPLIDGSHDWADEQVGDIVDAAYPDAMAWGVVRENYTEGAIGVGALPTYSIAVIDKDGAIRSIQPPSDKPGWPFDYVKARDARLAEFEKSRAAAGLPGQRMTPNSPGGSIQLPPPLPAYPESAFSRSGFGS